jgi:ribosome maturation factor RimP
MSADSRRGRAPRGRSPQAGRAARDRTARAGRSPHGGAAPDAIRQLLAPVVAAAGYDLEDVTVTPAGRRSLLRVVVDSDGGVSLDDVATVSRRVSAALDESDAMGAGPYVLEVTSPGVDRPLTEPRHWRRATGRLVRAPLVAGGEIEGRVVSADDEAVVFDTAIDAAPRRRGSGGEPERAPGLRRVGLGELGRGRVLVEFRRDETGDPAETDED